MFFHKIFRISLISRFDRVGGMLFLLLLLPACKKPIAQLPSNKVVAVDFVGLMVQEYNQVLIAKEDSLLQEFVNNQEKLYEKSEAGFWFHKEITNDIHHPLTNDSNVIVSYEMYDLHGNLLDKKENQTVHFGKKEVPVGIEEALKIMHNQKSVQFIIPSYLAFGAQGTDKIPPFASLMVVVEVP